MVATCVQALGALQYQLQKAQHAQQEGQQTVAQLKGEFVSLATNLVLDKEPQAVRWPRSSATARAAALSTAALSPHPTISSTIGEVLRGAVHGATNGGGAAATAVACRCAQAHVQRTASATRSRTNASASRSTSKRPEWSRAW